jgi:D-amino peptidase
VKVYISVDMEGLAGISHTSPTERGDAGYPAAVELMVGEANAAIEGAYDGGAGEVVVNDSHGQMFNLTPVDLDPRAVLVQGQKPWSMVQGGPGPGFGVALFVGYHARQVILAARSPTVLVRADADPARRPAGGRERDRRHRARRVGCPSG